MASEWSVCTESIAQTVGVWASIAASTDSRRVSASTCTGPQSASRRSERPRTWIGDSSPVTSIARPPAATLARACSTSVLLPMPGSPPSSTSDPGTRPPPRTRSSSTIPVVMRSGVSSVSSSSRVTAGTAPSALWRAAGAASSATVPHSPQVGQRPTHRGACAPQAPQLYDTRARDAVARGPRAGITTRSGRRANPRRPIPRRRRPSRARAQARSPGCRASCRRRPGRW